MLCVSKLKYRNVLKCRRKKTAWKWRCFQKKLYLSFSVWRKWHVFEGGCISKQFICIVFIWFYLTLTIVWLVFVALSQLFGCYGLFLDRNFGNFQLLFYYFSSSVCTRKWPAWHFQPDEQNVLNLFFISLSASALSWQRWQENYATNCNSCLVFWPELRLCCFTKMLF